MTSSWEIFSSAFVLLAFLGVAYGVYVVIQVIQEKTHSTTASLQSRGMKYQNGRLSVKTDRVAPTRDEYIASTQRAFEKGGQAFKNHPDAFKMGAPSAKEQMQAQQAKVEGKSSSVDSTPDRKGFQRGKKLA